MSKSQKNILFIVFFLFPSLLFSQIKDDKKSLVKILNTIQLKYNHQFIYADDVIQGVFLQDLPDSLTLQEAIIHLEKETGLSILFLDDNFIAIQKKDKTTLICGYIYDFETGLPLESATISEGKNYTLSDSRGYFSLKVSQESDSISIRFLGYQNLSMSVISFGTEKCSDLFLKSQFYTLSEAVLTNYLTKGISKLADGSFSINFSNFGILPGLIEADVLKTIQALPGIQSVNETVSTINIRGGTNDQNLLLWDGIRMYQSGHFFGLISVFNPSMTTSVSLIKNGTSADYTSGVSGTIAMKTSTEVNRKLESSFGSNFINVDAFVDAAIGANSSLQVSARKAINEFVETPTYTSYFDRILQNTEVGNNTANVINSDIAFDFYDISLRWLYDISKKDQLRINFIHIYNELMFLENAIIDQKEESKESSLIQNSIAAGLYYQRKWNANLVSSVQIYETDYKLKAVNSDILQHQELLQENLVSETSVKFSNWYNLNKRFVFSGGYQFTENGVNNITEIDNPLYKQLRVEVIREHGLFTEANYESNSKKTNIKVGARYSYIEKFKMHILEPRISANHKLVDNLRIEILGEMKHQNISQIINFQNDFLGIEKRRWRQSNNEDFPVIRSKQLSLGMYYSKKGWLISAEAYYKEVEGITSQSQGFLNQYIFEKAIGSYTVNGIELLVNKRNDKFSYWFSYTYADNKYTFNDFKEITFPNNLDIKHAVTFGSSYSSANFKVSTGFNWLSGTPTTKPVIGNEIVNNEINFEAANSSNIIDYLRLDISATYEFAIYKNIRAQMGASIWNILKTENILYSYYQIESGLPVEIQQTSLGLTPNLTFRVKF